MMTASELDAVLALADRWSTDARSAPTAGSGQATA